MTYTIVGFTSTAGATGIEPTGAASGDLLYAWAWDSSAGTTPTLATGWTTGTSAAAAHYAYLTASITRGGSAPSFAFTGATNVGVLALRGWDSGHAIVEANTTNDHTSVWSSASVASINNPSLVFDAFLLQASTTLTSPPTGYTAQQSSGNILLSYKYVTATSESPGTTTIGASTSGYAVTTAIPILTTTTVTATVTSSAAASQTVTKTVSSAAAVSSTATKTVTSMAAANRTQTKTVASTAAIGSIKQVSTTAAVSTTSTKTVSSAGAVSRTRTTTVTSQAAVSSPTKALVTSTAATKILKAVRMKGGYAVTSRGY